MALIKEKELKNCVVIKYWRIFSVELNKDFTVTEIKVMGYLDKPAREANKNPVEVQSFTVSKIELSDLDLLGNNPYKLGYEELKKEQFFEGAIDDL